MFSLLLRKFVLQKAGYDVITARSGQEALTMYVDKGMQYYEQRYQNQQIQLLQKRAAKLGLQLVPTQT